MYLIISTSLSPKSRSRIVAQYVSQHLEENQVAHELVDLRDHPLPFCDADQCYADPNVSLLGSKIAAADGILLATPIYNYNVCSAAKNLVELTGQSWKTKVVSFVCAAGGKSSYMTIMGLANSLMLDFRSFIVPRFVYVTGEHFEGSQLTDDDAIQRVEQMTDEWVSISQKLASD